MTNHHLSDTELQMVAGGKEIVDAATKHHLENCVLCREQLAIYAVMMNAIQEQPAPAFDFNLASAVLQQLPPVPEKKVFPLRPIIIAALIAMPLYLFRKNFLLLTSGISTLFLLLSIATCTVIIGFRIVKLYHLYQRQLDQLNISE